MAGSAGSPVGAGILPVDLSRKEPGRMPGLPQPGWLCTTRLAGAHPSIGRLIEVQALFGDNF